VQLLALALFVAPARAVTGCVDPNGTTGQRTCANSECEINELENGKWEVILEGDTCNGTDWIPGLANGRWETQQAQSQQDAQDMCSHFKASCWSWCFDGFFGCAQHTF